MKIYHAIMLSMLGCLADRFHVYHSAKNLRQRLEMVKRVHGMDGIEVVYPSEFANPNEAIQLLKDSGLAISAVNLNVKSEKRWENGSFTSPDPKIRAAAVSELKAVIDLAAELGTKMVSCCPLIDGHNYSFEVDYLEQWIWLVEGLKEGGQHRTDIKLSLEYKLNESRNYNLLSDMGRTLYLCQSIGLPNVGITMDVGHALIAKETPAEAIALAAQAGRLFYIHFNDNGRDWDWDMIPGSINLWDLLEVMFYVKRLDWEGWVSYDVVTRKGDIVKNMEASISIIEQANKLVEKIGMEKLEGFIKTGDPAQNFDELMRSLL
jgi:xylose isomerase